MKVKTQHIMTERDLDAAFVRYRNAVEVGRRIRYFRTQAGLSQVDVGAYAGVSGATISRTEHGRRRMPPLERTAVARALGISPAVLIHGTNGNGKAAA